MTVSELILQLQKFDQNMQVKTCIPSLFGATELHDLEPAGLHLVGAVKSVSKRFPEDVRLIVDTTRYYAPDGMVYRLKNAIDRGEPTFVVALH